MCGIPRAPLASHACCCRLSYQHSPPLFLTSAFFFSFFFFLFLSPPPPPLQYIAGSWRPIQDQEARNARAHCKVASFPAIRHPCSETDVCPRTSLGACIAADRKLKRHRGHPESEALRARKGIERICTGSSKSAVQRKQIIGRSASRACRRRCCTSQTIQSTD